MLPGEMLKQVQHDKRKVWQIAAPYNPKGGFGCSAAANRWLHARVLPHEKTDPRLGWKLREANSPHRLSRTEIVIRLTEPQFVGEPLKDGAGKSRAVGSEWWL